MKKSVLIVTTLIGLLCLESCQHSAKDPDVASLKEMEQPVVAKDDVVKETITDRHGDEMEVITNNTKNTVIVRLNGQTYEFEKDQETPSFSTEDNQYQFTETKYEVTLLKKNVDMVLFHGQRDQANAKMASQ